MSKKSFLPKKIAGVKVPKKARKGRFGELLASPSGQAAIAEAVQRYRADQAAPTADGPSWPELAARPSDAPEAQPR